MLSGCPWQEPELSLMQVLCADKSTLPPYFRVATPLRFFFWILITYTTILPRVLYPSRIKMTSIRLTHDGYIVGWICALPLEMTAAELVLDNEHERLFQPREDQNTYVLGDISGYNEVIACLPAGVVGTSSPSLVGSRMKSTYKNIRFGLLIGVGGGAPSTSNDIRLGDVVVSKPGPSPSGMALSGVVQYDFGKTIHSGNFID
ncbi:purine and uridine phosphorylase [Penicillium malachiteum]|nr:purine and uridine phosphorylase [Penicillium malachiteum]